MVGDRSKSAPYSTADICPAIWQVSFDAGLQQMANQQLLPKVDIDEMSEIMAKAVRLYRWR